MKKLILIGEIKIGERGCVHQADFATALNAERLTGWPKSMDEVQVIVGTVLAGRKPALLLKAEKNGVPVSTVEDVMTNDVRAELRTLLAMKSKRETYEQAALDALNAMEDKPADKVQEPGITPTKPPRGKKGSKKAAA